MKDDRLEKQFDEYFGNVNIPDNITADAKKYVKKPFMPAFVKFACAAASFALVLTVSLAVFFSVRTQIPADTDKGAQVSVYDESDLAYRQTDVYGITEINKSLDFIRNLAYRGASVSDCSAGYIGGELAIVKSDVSLIDGLNRYDAEIFVEFTENSVYSPLKKYSEGAENSYNGVAYYLTRATAENGEPVCKLHFVYGGTKYYFNVTSSDENSYLKCLRMIIK